MKDSQRSHKRGSDQRVVGRSKTTTIASSDVGVTLIISKEALAKLEQFREESLSAVRERQVFYWR